MDQMMDPVRIHRNKIGKIATQALVRIDNREQLNAYYTPGVAQVSQLIVNSPEMLRETTLAGRTVAVISDGTAVLGLGNVGAKAALPVMESKALLLKELGGVDAFPICIDSESVEQFISTVKSISLNFAAINLEDIAAPSCFEIEERLRADLDIPVLHDDQHATAIAVLAALFSAVKVRGVDQSQGINVVVNGAGAAGNSIIRLLHDQNQVNISQIIALDSKGIISEQRTDLSPDKSALLPMLKRDISGDLSRALEGSDLFIGVSVGDILSASQINSLMNRDPIIFALANPQPEISKLDVDQSKAFIYASGRGDYPNQINNALVFPGLFKGLIRTGVRIVTQQHKVALAESIFQYNLPNLSKETLLPDVLDKNFHSFVAEQFEKLNSVKSDK